MLALCDLESRQRTLMAHSLAVSGSEYRIAVTYQGLRAVRIPATAFVWRAVTAPCSQPQPGPPSTAGPGRPSACRPGVR